MVIVDVRPTGGRGDTGIPTDAYFAVDEIKDVRATHFTLSCRTLFSTKAALPASSHALFLSD